VVGFCEHGNEPSGFIKCPKFTARLNDYQLLMRASFVGVGLLVNTAWRLQWTDNERSVPD
jgi:hypothetical protein